MYNPIYGHIATSIVPYQKGYQESEIISCVKLDNWATDNKISKIDFIKADIEGAERKMLLGAKDILKYYAPRLSICTYHFPDDPEVIKNIILDANPNYIIDQESHKLFAYTS